MDYPKIIRLQRPVYPPLDKPREGQSLASLLHELTVKEQQLKVHLDAVRKYPNALHNHNYFKAQLLQVQQPPSIVPRHMTEMLAQKLNVDLRTANTILERLPLYQIRTLLAPELDKLAPMPSESKEPSQQPQTEVKEPEDNSTNILQTQATENQDVEILQDDVISSSYADLFDPIVSALKEGNQSIKKSNQNLRKDIYRSTQRLTQRTRVKVTQSPQPGLTSFITEKVESILQGNLPKSLNLTEIVNEVIQDEETIQKSLNAKNPIKIFEEEVLKVLQDIRS